LKTTPRRVRHFVVRRTSVATRPHRYPTVHCTKPSGFSCIVLVPIPRWMEIPSLKDPRSSYERLGFAKLVVRRTADSTPQWAAISCFVTNTPEPRQGRHVNRKQRENNSRAPSGAAHDLRTPASSRTRRSTHEASDPNVATKRAVTLSVMTASRNRSEWNPIQRRSIFVRGQIAKRWNQSKLSLPAAAL